MDALNRMGTIAHNTFTQLVRMKVFGFFVVFALIMIASLFFKLPNANSLVGAEAQELRMIKGSAMGAMSLFAVIFSVAATGLLLPRDVEDRTLYTILGKPVPRFDYLVGKYLGVVLTILISLLLMDVLMVLALKVRTAEVVAERVAVGERLGWSAELIEIERNDILRHSNSWSTQAGVFAIFLKSLVMAGVALLISTFSTSTLFTIIMGFVVYFIGHFSGEARDYWLSQSLDTSPLVRAASHLVSVVFPDFRVFNIIDGSIEGLVISLKTVLQLTLISLIYAAVYLVLSWFTFAKKEF